MKLPAVTILYLTLLGCLALLPFVSLFWDKELFILKINWVVYPFFIFGILSFVLARGRVNSQFILFSAVSVFYFVIFLLRPKSDLENFVRVIISVLPFIFLPFFSDENLKRNRTFFVLYTVFFIPAFHFAYLQYTGKMPYYDFDYIDGQQIGRMSGGYSKPMNFIAFLTPLYILGLYLITVRKQRFLGGIFTLAILGIVYLIGHRTSLAAFVLILVAMFFKRITFFSIYNYYKYYLNFFTGLIIFGSVYVLKLREGLVDAIRGRIPMWQAHAEQFFESNILTVLFGMQRVQLPDYYEGHPLVVRLDEVHNNSFRTILLFGIFGFFIYCTFMRWVVLSSYHSQPDQNKRFIIFACFIYYISYTITNEPVYYASIIWPILIWIFLLRGPTQQHSI